MDETVPETDAEQVDVAVPTDAAEVAAQRRERLDDALDRLLPRYADVLRRLGES